MSGEIDLKQLLSSLQPELGGEDYVFCVLESQTEVEADIQPLATFRETEGITWVLSQSEADSAQLAYQGVFKRITLTVHSSLEAVGLTAAVASVLAEHGISANVIAAYYHDHVFVPKAKAHKALALLSALSKDAVS
ncbi:ACT domain-containing protein [Vibrio sp. WXL103]|uniref:ACT domain-containing protein n=1 Tax=Vibrio sp. WXL103 TaxID=3450710 RepID=UPI003EC7E88D